MTLDSLRLAVEQQGVFAIGIGFVAGLLFSFNPVAIASVPVALAYVTKSRERSQAVRFGLFFVLGMIVMHVALGFLSGLIGRSLEEVIGRPWGMVLGPILIVLGAIWIFELSVPLPSLPFRARRPSKLWGAFLLGMPFSVAVCPICTPALVVLLGATAALGSALVGALLLAAFALGRSVPILLGAFAIGWLKRAPAVDRFRRPFEIVSGLMMLLAGFYMLNAYFIWIPTLAG